LQSRQITIVKGFVIGRSDFEIRFKPQHFWRESSSPRPKIQHATMSGAEEAEATLLLSQPIVIDNGSSSIKAGFAGTSKPKVRLQNGFLSIF
jgi:hypothetical protein